MHYLSDEWIEAAGAAVEGLTPAADAFAVTYVVTDMTSGDSSTERAYTLTLGPDVVSVLPGGGAPVGLRMTIETARAIAKGTMSAQRAFLDGDMRITGDAQALVGHREELAAADERLASVRALTEF